MMGASWPACRARWRHRRPVGSARIARSPHGVRLRSARPGGPSRAGSRRSARAVSASARRSRAPDIVSRSRSSWASASSPCSRAIVACSTACSATLSRPGLRSPRVFRSWSALSSFLRARLVPRSAPLIEAWSRSRRAPSSRDRSLSSKWWTDAVERKNPSVGMPVSSAMTWSARVGSEIDWPS